MARGDSRRDRELGSSTTRGSFDLDPCKLSDRAGIPRRAQFLDHDINYVAALEGFILSGFGISWVLFHCVLACRVRRYLSRARAKLGNPIETNEGAANSRFATARTIF